jgi:hypothetical protein
MNHNNRVFGNWFLIAALLVISGCGDSEDMAMRGESAAPMMDMGFAKEAGNQQAPNPYMAYEYSVSVELEEEELQAAYQNALDTCRADSANACEILYSNLRTGDYPGGDLRVRIKKPGVTPFIKAATADHEIIEQNVSAEDLAQPIFDNEKRLKMLEGFQQRLAELENQSTKDVDSLIKIASEISRVQSELEAAKGENEFLMKRVNLDIVSIHFVTDPEDSIVKPIGDAFEDFAHNVAKGIGTAVTVIAFMIPWLILAVALFMLWRWLRRRKSY